MSINKVMSAIKVITMIIMIAMFVWIFASWMNIAFNNTNPEQVANQWSWNFFRVLFAN